tara:strand:+ start:401 stop:862 length:462 start_codon:yes stop_codon:yes gene_type:complete
VSLTSLEDAPSLLTLVAGLALLSPVAITTVQSIFESPVSNTRTQDELKFTVRLLGASVAAAIHPIPIASLLKLLQFKIGEPADEGDVIAVLEFAVQIAAGATAGQVSYDALDYDRELDKMKNSGPSSLLNPGSFAAVLGSSSYVLLTELIKKR